jgi:hypothetical protein
MLNALAALSAKHPSSQVPNRRTMSDITPSVGKGGGKIAIDDQTFNDALAGYIANNYQH